METLFFVVTPIALIDVFKTREEVMDFFDKLPEPERDFYLIKTIELFKETPVSA